MMMCTPENPGLNGTVYHLPYIEAVEGKRHAYMTRYNGVEWTRNTYHPQDSRCPECADMRSPK